jgi:hypothetical protein
MPRGFVRIRCYGLLANCLRPQRLAQLLGAGHDPTAHLRALLFEASALGQPFSALNPPAAQPPTL